MPETALPVVDDSGDKDEKGENQCRICRLPPRWAAI
jgi:hypothetical protein